MSDVDISQAHNELRLIASLAHLDTGAGRARLRLYGDTRPAPGASPTGPLLAEITLLDPSGSVSANTLTLSADGTGLVLNSGSATWARFVNGNGDWSIDARVSNTAGDAPVKLSDTTLYAGGQVALISAVLG